MLYREIVPHAALSPFVRCFWMLSSSGAAVLPPQLVLPDGCTELVFHLGDPFVRWREVSRHATPSALFADDLKGGSREVQPRAFAMGQIERAILIQPTGRAHVLAVRFHPAGLSAFTPVPQQHLRGRTVTCEELWGSAAGRALWDLAESRGLDGIERFLRERLRPRHLPPHVSDRQNRRRFQEIVGLPPKRLRRIERLQRAMAQIGRRDLAAIALEAGYFDQPHFTREFRDFTGQTPAQFLREPHAFSDFFTQSHTQTPASLIIGG